jgi:hypothetical protein
MALVAGARESEQHQEGPNRICLNALALRTIMAEDLSDWETHASRGGDASEQRQVLLDRLRLDVTAYQVVSDHIQRQQDAALTADIQALADELRRAKQGLFSNYLKVSSIIKGGGADSAAGGTAEGAGTTTIAVGDLLQEAVAADAAAEAQRGKEVTKEKVYLDALNEMRKDSSEPAVAPELVISDPKRERSRLIILSAAAVVMLAACVSVYILTAPGKSADPELSVADLPSALAPSRAVAVGPMLYAQVNSWIWDDMTKPQREARVNEIADSARARGYETVYLTDEKNRDLARWTAGEGITLAKSKP